MISEEQTMKDNEEQTMKDNEEQTMKDNKEQTMKDNKKKGMLVLSVLATLCLGAGLTACGGQGKVTLQNFLDSSETVLLGEEYTLPSPVVFDTSGNEYIVAYSVKDSSGETVEVVGNQFVVADMGGYKIENVVNIGAQEYKKTLTLNVVDEGAPVVTVDKSETGLVDEPFTLPEYTVSDLSGTVSSCSATLLYGETAVETSNGAFIPKKGGVYTYRIEAEDASGNKTVKDQPLYVRDLPAVDEIESFSEFFSSEFAEMSYSASSAYLEEDGPQSATHGYVRFSLKPNGWPHLLVAPRRAPADYADYSRVEITLRVNGDLDRVGIMSWIGNKEKTTVAANRWVTLLLDASYFKNMYTQAGEQLDWLWLDGKNVESVDVYGMKVSNTAAYTDTGINTSFNAFSGNTALTAETITAADIEKDGALPPLLQGCDSYTRLSGQGTGNITYGFKDPSFTLQQFLEADKLIFKLRASAREEANENLGVYVNGKWYANFKWKKPGWQKIFIDLSPYNEAARKDIYNRLFTGLPFEFQSNGNTDVTAYIASIGVIVGESFAQFSDEAEVSSVTHWTKSATAYEQRFIDAATAEAEGLPPVPAGSTGYLRLKFSGHKENEMAFVGIKPDCTLETFQKATKLTIKYYCRESVISTKVNGDWHVNFQKGEIWQEWTLDLTKYYADKNKTAKMLFAAMGDNWLALQLKTNGTPSTLCISSVELSFD